MGQFDEAELALKSYLDMVEINFKVKSDDAQDILTNEQRIRLDIESEYDITTVMVAGSRLYGKELAKPEEALSCAQRALDNIHQYLQHADVKDLLFDVYKFQGIAYGLQASEGKQTRQRYLIINDTLWSIHPTRTHR